jgi:hypothetical protein
VHLRLEKPWRDLSADETRALPGQLGVFQLANAEGEVVYIGYAGGRELFGLRSAIERHRALGTGAATRFRYEVNMQYQSRYRELLMLHRADNGALPVANEHEHPVRLGRIG